MSDEHPLALLILTRRSDVDDLRWKQRERPSLGQHEVEAEGGLPVPPAPFGHSLEHGEAAADPPRLRGAGDVGNPVHPSWLEAESLHNAAISDQAGSLGRAGLIRFQAIRSV